MDNSWFYIYTIISSFCAIYLVIFERIRCILLYIRTLKLIFNPVINRRMKKRIFYIISFLVIFCIEVLIALYVRDNFVRPYIGDVLVVVLVYSFVRIFLPTGIPRMPFYVFLFACFVEVMQYFRLVETLGITNRAARIILGSTFDWKDIACYAVGCILIFLFERNSKKRL